MSRGLLGTLILGWSFACAGGESTETPQPDPVASPAPDAGGGAVGKARKGGKSKAGGRETEGELVGFEQGDLLHVTVKTADGKEHGLVCVDAACEEAQGWPAGTAVVVEHERRPVQVNDAQTEEMDVVVSIEEIPVGD